MKMLSEIDKNYIKLMTIAFVIVSVIIFSTLGCFSLDNQRGKKKMITKKMAIDIADKKIKELNYDIQTMEIYLDDGNSKWNNYLLASHIEKDQPELVIPLKNRIYWAIYYAPRLHQYGGDLWVFVDKETGVIITVIQGE